MGYRGDGTAKRLVGGAECSEGRFYVMGTRREETGYERWLWVKSVEFGLFF